MEELTGMVLAARIGKHRVISKTTAGLCNIVQSQSRLHHRLNLVEAIEIYIWNV